MRLIRSRWSQRIASCGSGLRPSEQRWLDLDGSSNDSSNERELQGGPLESCRPAPGRRFSDGLGRTSDPPHRCTDSAGVENHLDVLGVAGENGVSGAHNETEVTVDRIGGSASSQQLSDQSSSGAIECCGVDASQHTGQVRLEGSVSPHLCDHGSASSDRDRLLLSDPQHRADHWVLPIDADQSSGIEHERHQAAVPRAFRVTPSSLAAASSSLSLNGVDASSHASRAAPSNSLRRRSAAAATSQAETLDPDRAAASRTDLPRSGSMVTDRRSTCMHTIVTHTVVCHLVSPCVYARSDRCSVVLSFVRVFSCLEPFHCLAQVCPAVAGRAWAGVAASLDHGLVMSSGSGPTSEMPSVLMLRHSLPSSFGRGLTSDKATSRRFTGLPVICPARSAQWPRLETQCGSSAPVPFGRTASTSTSLAGVACPRANDPNTTRAAGAGAISVAAPRS